MLRIGIDIGGTFTDFAVWRNESDGYVSIASRKLPTSRPDFAEAVIEGVEEIVRSFAIDPAEPITVVHGTTISTNAVIERSEPPIGLITTTGFRDILNIARLRLAKQVNLFNYRTEPLVPRRRVLTVDERIRADGSVDTPLDEAGLLEAVATLVERGATGVAICFMHAYRNNLHERRALEIARAAFPTLEIIASHEVWPEKSEYERAMLTLLNLYVKRLMGSYLGRIEEFLADSYPQAKLLITKSNGGLMSAEEARGLPIHTLLSGPAAGVTAARTLGGYHQLEEILTLDMGGTSTDVSLIDRGHPMIAAQAQVGDFPLQMPVTAVEAIGAGGGSIIWLDEGVLKVGPRSAGSAPGPACFGQGGTAPTLSDAYLIAGYLAPRGLLGGKMALDRGLAERAFAPVCDALRMEVIEVAESAIAVASSNMLAKINPFLGRIGVDALDLTLMIFGGAGGIHGPLLAEEIGIRAVIVPRLPSVFCAFGALASDLVHDSVRSVTGETVSSAERGRVFEELRHEGHAWLKRQRHVSQTSAETFQLMADMRYTSQSFTIPVDLSAVAARGDLPGEASTAFHAEHTRLFGHANESVPVAFDNLRVRSIGRQAKPGASRLPTGDWALAPAAERRRVRFDGVWIEDVAVYEWPDLQPGWSASGPCIVQQDLATVLVPPAYRAMVGTLGDLELSRI